MGQDFGYARVSEPLAGDVRGAQVRCASVSSYERLQADTSVCERVRARQVAFSRANFLFFRARLGVFCRHLSSFVVIFRPKIVFSGMEGNGRLRHWLGKGASSLLCLVPAAGAGCASCHDIRFKLVCNCGRAAAAFVYVPHNCTSILRSVQFHGISGCIPDYCVSSKAKSLKQLRPASTVQSGKERGHGVRGLTRPAHASLFERLPNNLFAGRFDSAAAVGVTRRPEKVVRILCYSHSLQLDYPLSSSQIIGTHPGVMAIVAIVEVSLQLARVCDPDGWQQRH